MLSIPLETVAWIIVKAREYDVKDTGADGVADDDDDDNPLGVLEDRADDPTGFELASWISDLTDTQKAELVAIFWLGRGGADAGDFAELVAEARDQQGGERTARYLLGSPMFGDHLEAGLEALGHDVSEIENRIL